MTETMEYQVTEQRGEVEIRHYPAGWVATVAGKDEGETFGVLFRYITGNNQPGQKIPMTAPVITPVNPDDLSRHLGCGEHVVCHAKRYHR